ncbi:MAG: TrmB family transcriptional regulator [Candidatus Woesearchaeota archaeon]
MLEELQNIGMDSKEAQIYRTLLQLGKGTVNQILKKTTIERRTIYDILERLMQKGFASYYEDNGTKTFLPTNPQILLEDMDKKRESFSKILPKLNSLKEVDENASLELLKGKQGVKTIFLEIQHTSKIHYAFGNINHFVDKLDIDTKRFLTTIESKKHTETIIYPKGEKILKIKGGQYRVLDRKKMPPTPVIIYNNTTCLFMFGEPIQIIKITSKEITKSYIEYFNTYWNMAEKIGSNK